MSNYYDNPASFPYPERATLIEAVKIPINVENLTLSYFDPELKEETVPTESGEDSCKIKYYEFAFDKVFNLPWNLLPSSVEGKFRISILMPTIETTDEDAIDKNTRTPKQTGFKGQKIISSSYQSSNYVNLKIPRYMLYQFIGSTKVTVDGKTKTAYATIPKGTEFILVSIGSKSDSTKMRLIGLYTVD